MSISLLVAGGLLRRGSSGSTVAAVQAALNSLGHKIPETGKFDEPTANAVMGFQRQHKLKDVDGIVGPETAAAIDALMKAPAGATVQTEVRSDFMAAPIWFQWMLHEIGMHEVGNNRGPDVERYIRLGKCGKLGDPYCAIGMNAGLEVNGLPGSRSAGSQSFRHDPNFVQLAGPALGAITVFWRTSRNSGLGHVGAYRGEDATRVFTLGFNQSDGCNVSPYPKSSATFGLVGYWWPKAVPLPKIGPIPMRAGQAMVSLKVV